jgi:hypothetical protein
MEGGSISAKTTALESHKSGTGTAQGEDGGSNRLDKSTIKWGISRLNASRYAWVLGAGTNRNSIVL